eukprot:2228111-Rhodomonas_salina.3
MGEERRPRSEREQSRPWYITIRHAHTRSHVRPVCTARAVSVPHMGRHTGRLAPHVGHSWQVSALTPHSKQLRGSQYRTWATAC